MGKRFMRLRNRGSKRTNGWLVRGDDTPDPVFLVHGNSSTAARASAHSIRMSQNHIQIEYIRPLGYFDDAASFDEKV
jgi:hypothetical protein